MSTCLKIDKHTEFFESAAGFDLKVRPAALSRMYGWKVRLACFWLETSGILRINFHFRFWLFTFVVTFTMTKFLRILVTFCLYDKPRYWPPKNQNKLPNGSDTWKLTGISKTNKSLQKLSLDVRWMIISR